VTDVDPHLKLHRWIWKGLPTRTQALLLEWLASVDDKSEAEMYEEIARVGGAFSEACQSGDAIVLKCEAESKVSIAKRESDGLERLDMISKWYVANRGELKSPLWEKIAARKK
jgi:hypothetical protein